VDELWCSLITQISGVAGMERIVCFWTPYF